MTPFPWLFGRTQRRSAHGPLRRLRRMCANAGRQGFWGLGRIALPGHCPGLSYSAPLGLGIFLCTEP